MTVLHEGGMGKGRRDGGSEEGRDGDMDEKLKGTHHALPHSDANICAETFTKHMQKGRKICM